MLLFPHAKINLGLQVGAKRSDGFHEILTCFFPVPIYDLLELTPSKKIQFQSTGIRIPGDPRENLCLKAYGLLNEAFDLPPVRIHLHKTIPMGAGLGGGSSDAAYALKGLNQLYVLGLKDKDLEGFALKLGSDCPYFIKGKIQIGSGRGEVLNPYAIPLGGHWIHVVNPGIHISTREAYQKAEKTIPFQPIQNLLGGEISTWNGKLNNDFQEPLEKEHPELADIRTKLEKSGAVYTSMSGSGSSYFGIYRENPGAISWPKHYFPFTCQL